MVSFFIDKALNVLEIRDMARNRDGALLLKSIFLFGFLEKFLKQRMVYIHHRYYETLLLFSCAAHVDGHAALGNGLVKIVTLFLGATVGIMMMKMQMQMEVREMQRMGHSEMRAMNMMMWIVASHVHQAAFRVSSGKVVVTSEATRTQFQSASVRHYRIPGPKGLNPRKLGMNGLGLEEDATARVRNLGGSERKGPGICHGNG